MEKEKLSRSMRLKVPKKKIGQKKRIFNSNTVIQIQQTK